MSDYGAREGWLDPGEEAVLTRVGSSSQGGPILDIGVGGGRTAPLLRQFSDNYVGTDYTNEMVEAARAHYPDAEARRDLWQLGLRATSRYTTPQALS